MLQWQVCDCTQHMHQADDSATQLQTQRRSLALTAERLAEGLARVPLGHIATQIMGQIEELVRAMHDIGEDKAAARQR